MPPPGTGILSFGLVAIPVRIHTATKSENVFVNLPKDANAYDQQRGCKLRNCVIEVIACDVQVLKSPDAPRNEKRIALRFTAHLVGDIHQPLHAGFAEDRGGNSVEVRFNGRKETLHSLWDTALVELEQGTSAEIAARIQAMMSSNKLQQSSKGHQQNGLLSRLQCGHRSTGYPRRARSMRATQNRHVL